jgi:hypothetical protein
MPDIKFAEVQQYITQWRKQLIMKAVTTEEYETSEESLDLCRQIKLANRLYSQMYSQMYSEPKIDLSIFVNLQK